MTSRPRDESRAYPAVRDSILPPERLAALEAERARPDARPPTIQELLARLVATLAAAHRTPPDGHDAEDLHTLPGRMAAFARYRSHGLSIYWAARRAGVSYETGRRYEHQLNAQQGAA